MTIYCSCINSTVSWKRTTGFVTRFLRVYPTLMGLVPAAWSVDQLKRLVILGSVVFPLGVIRPHPVTGAANIPLQGNLCLEFADQHHLLDRAGKRFTLGTDFFFRHTILNKSEVGVEGIEPPMSFYTNAFTARCSQPTSALLPTPWGVSSLWTRQGRYSRRGIRTPGGGIMSAVL